MDNDGYQGAKKKRPLYTHARNAPRICARFSSRKSPEVSWNCDVAFFLLHFAKAPRSGRPVRATGRPSGKHYERCGMSCDLEGDDCSDAQQSSMDARADPSVSRTQAAHTATLPRSGDMTFPWLAKHRHSTR